MNYFAILDTNAGLLHWLGRAENSTAALEAMQREIGPDFSEENLNVYKLTAPEAKQVRRWWDHGGLSNETPGCLR
jgi:hypothetical protein